jgi:hypothetical protein
MNFSIKKFLGWTVAAIIVVALGFASAHYYFNDTQVSVPQANTSDKSASNTQSNQPTITPIESLGILSRAKETNFPEVDQTVAQKTVAKSSLPANLVYFFPGNNEAVATTSVTFTDKSTGFKTSFEYAADAITASNYFKKLSLSKYNFLEGIHRDDAALLLVQDSKYTYELSFIKTANDSTSVVILAKAK